MDNRTSSPTPPTPPPPPPPLPPMDGVAPPDTGSLIAAIDMGTNSFKLLLARPHPLLPGRFLPVDRLSSPVLLGRSLAPDSSLPAASILRAVAALRSFSSTLRSLPVSRLRAVATSAVRDAPNRHLLLRRISDELNLPVDVLSGEDEARLIYRGVLQFLPLHHKTLLNVDIGGGSTELVVGREGTVLFAASLKLGHVTLTETLEFQEFQDLRRHVRAVLAASPAIEKIKEIGFEVAVGSSGTAKSIERAISLRNGDDCSCSRDWGFSRVELGVLVDKLSGLGVGDVEMVRRLGFSKKRCEFIVAGAVLLLELFDALGIKEMEVSRYSLAEGVISEMLEEECSEYDVNANARWRSVVGLAARFDGDGRMKSAVQCVSIAKEIFDGVKRHYEVADCGSRSVPSLDGRDFEYLEAAILLHNIGMMFGKKGYHKRSYDMIKNSRQLHGFSSEEIEIVALLARFHRKKFPKRGHDSLQNLSSEIKQKIRVLCVIIRVSHALQQRQCMASHGLKVSSTGDGFELVFGGLEDGPLVYHPKQKKSATADAVLQTELEHFEEVFRQRISVSFSSNA